ncbi:MAG: hypothetical protein ACRD33_00835 [Candidatus Acidiferrales bacterium]
MLKQDPGRTKLHIIRVKIFGPENGEPRRHRFRAGNGHIFTEEGVASVLEHVGNHLEQKFPGQDFRMVEIGEGEFNFVWAGSRKPS